MKTAAEAAAAGMSRRNSRHAVGFSGLPLSLSLSLAAVVVLLLGALPSAHATFGWPYLKSGGDSACPLTHPSWKQSGCSGGIVDPDTKAGAIGSANLLFQYYPQVGRGCGSATTCKQLCASWPYYNGKRMTAFNGDNGGCAYWSWNGDRDCYLYGCGVCKSFRSFFSKARCSNTGRQYSSGAGPAADRCPGSGVKGDPHFSGADESHFDFTGVPGQTYCLVTDSHLHINAYYGGRFAGNGTGEGKPLTWIRQVGVLWGHHSLKLEARQGAEWAYHGGYMARMEADGQEVKLSQAGDSLSHADGQIVVKWVSAGERSGDDEVDVYAVTIRGVLSLRLTLRPEVPELRTTADGVVHFNLEFQALDLSDKAHGVLGQTYRQDHQGRLSKQSLEFNDVLQVHMVRGQNAEGFLDGSVKDYVASDLLATDCAVSRFARLSALDSETSHAMEFNSASVVSSSSSSSSSASTLPRKILMVV